MTKSQREALEDAYRLINRIWVSHHANACDAVLEQIKSILAEPDVPEGWQPIETAPETTSVFVWMHSYGITTASKTTTHGIAQWCARGENKTCNPTHFMPLPAAPKKED